MKKNYSILRILADWNPLDIPNAIVNEEYASYVPVLSEKTNLKNIRTLAMSNEDLYSFYCNTKLSESSDMDKY